MNGELVISLNVTLPRELVAGGSITTRQDIQLVKDGDIYRLSCNGEEKDATQDRDGAVNSLQSLVNQIIDAL